MKRGPESNLVDNRPKKKSKSFAQRLKDFFVPAENAVDENEPIEGPFAQLPTDLLVDIFSFVQGSDEKPPLQLREVSRTWCAVQNYCLAHQVHQGDGLLTMHRANGFINRLMGWTEETQHSVTTEAGRLALFDEQQQKIDNFKKYKWKINVTVNSGPIWEALHELENLPTENHIVALWKRKKALDTLNKMIIRQRIEESIKNNKAILNCDKSYITDFPASIIDDPSLSSFWNKLTHLWLDDCCLKTLPSNIGMLKNLKEIRIFNNDLSSLPDSFSELTALRSLHLQCNRFTVFPEVVCQLKALEYLSFGYDYLYREHGTGTGIFRNFPNNQLTSLSSNIGNLKSLKHLGLGHNSLTTLPSSLIELTSLKELDLSDNLFSELPDTLVNLPALERLNVNGNCLSRIQADLEKKLKNWRTLYRLPEASQHWMTTTAQAEKKLNAFFTYR